MNRLNVIEGWKSKVTYPRKLKQSLIEFFNKQEHILLIEIDGKKKVTAYSLNSQTKVI